MSKSKFVDPLKLNLADWLNIVLYPENNKDIETVFWQFPTQEHLEEYLQSINTRSNDEIKSLLNLLLIPNGHLGSDRHTRSWLFSLSEENRNKILLKHSYYKRLMDFSKDSHPWQGISWTIDLLPNYPQEAISAINSYVLAHIQELPDGRITGMGDAEIIIRKKYLEHNLPVRNSLLTLTPRDFELLCAYLYMKKGFEVTITPRSRDGGYDVLAEKQSSREQERLYIECKRYTERVGVRIVRATLGTLLVTKATKAVIITSSDFTRPSKQEGKSSNRIELINCESFDADMRKFVNPNWTTFISKYILEMKKSLLDSE